MGLVHPSVRKMKAVLAPVKQRIDQQKQALSLLSKGVAPGIEVFICAPSISTRLRLLMERFCSRFGSSRI
jgi:hypothetical protein